MRKTQMSPTNLHSSQRHPGTSVFASPEGHVRSDIWSAHDELFGPLEDLRIAIGGRVAQRDRFFGTYYRAVQMDVFGRCTCETSVRAVKSKELFHRRRNQGLIFPQLVLQIFVLGEMMAYRSDQDWWGDDTNHESLSKTTAIKQSLAL